MYCLVWPKKVGLGQKNSNFFLRGNLPLLSGTLAYSLSSPPPAHFYRPEADPSLCFFSSRSMHFCTRPVRCAFFPSATLIPGRPYGKDGCPYVHTVMLIISYIVIIMNIYYYNLFNVLNSVTPCTR